MSLNVRSGQGQVPTFVVVPAVKPLALAAISPNVGAAINTTVSVSNIPGLSLSEFDAVAQQNQRTAVTVQNRPGLSLHPLIADPNFSTRVFATRPQLAIGGSGFVHGVMATNAAPSVVAENDFLARALGPGVVWYHDFLNAAEVNLFRWTTGYGDGNDPLGNSTRGANTRLEADAGPAYGGAIAITRDAGSNESPHWIRFFAPLDASSNGRGVADPAANGTLTLRSFSPTDGGNQSELFTNGWYGQPAGSDSHFDGKDYWLQYRAKRDPARSTGDNATHTVGKHIFLGFIETGAGEFGHVLVIYSYGGGNPNNYFRIYGGTSISNPLNPDPNDIQPGGVTPYWSWAIDGTWHTIMYHMVPGSEGNNDTILEVYVARDDEAVFTKIWDQTFTLRSGFYAVRQGFQTVQCSTYNNGYDFTVPFTDRWAQMIFSQDWIPLPNVDESGNAKTALAAATLALEAA